MDIKTTLYKMSGASGVEEPATNVYLFVTDAQNSDYPQGNIGVAHSLAIYALCEGCSFDDKMLMPFSQDPDRPSGDFDVPDPVSSTAGW